MSAKQANYDKLQVSAATYLRCDGVVYKQTKKGIVLSLWVKSFKSLNIGQSYKQERCCLMHFAHLANTLLKDQLGIELKRWVRELGIWWAKRNHALRGIADPSRNRNFFGGGAYFGMHMHVWKRAIESMVNVIIIIIIIIIAILSYSRWQQLR